MISRANAQISTVAQQAQAQQQAKFDNQALTATTQDQLTAATTAAKAAGITISPDAVTHANTAIQQVQQQNFLKV